MTAGRVRLVASPYSTPSSTPHAHVFQESMNDRPRLV